MRIALVLLLFTFAAFGRGEESGILDSVKNGIEDADKKLTKRLETLSNTVGALSRQMMLQQLFIEERIRSEAHSGVKQVRHSREGTRNYYADTHTSSNRLLAIHEHANNDRTVGMGEFIAVMNGVEFRTRHNDYRLYMPHTTNKDWHATEPIPFPDVPPEVLKQPTLEEQIKEMREWFKAWNEQNYTARDYRKYFKPVLCYLEGAWTADTKGNIDEPFESDRHFINAKSWFDLQEKIRFTSYTGRKDNLENFAFLPTTIIGMINDTFPVFAQWNYRILCHPLKRDVPLNRFRVVDEISPRLAARRTFKHHSTSRAARFQLNPFDTDGWKEGPNNKNWGLLDKLMSEVPGKDNYQGKLTDEAFDLPVHSLNPDKQGKLNVGYYHRWYKVQARGAMGLSTRHRGFSDENLFMAMTTQHNVAGMNLTTCRWGNRNCKTVAQKWSYAIPLEIIWLSPLSKWNPHKLEYKGAENTPLGKTVYADGRYGAMTPNKAYNGTNSRKYYFTPSEFYIGREVGSESADTTKNVVGVLDRSGKVHATRASGTRIFLPPIPGVGTLRQRYPIVPVHGEGSSVWKELEALKDLVLQSQTYGYMYREALPGAPALPTEPPMRDLTYETEPAGKTPPGPHKHEIYLTAIEVRQMVRQGLYIKKTTSSSAGHEHTVLLQHARWSKNKLQFYIRYCDARDQSATRCWDQHGRYAVERTDA